MPPSLDSPYGVRRRPYWTVRRSLTDRTEPYGRVNRTASRKPKSKRFDPGNLFQVAHRHICSAFAVPVGLAHGQVGPGRAVEHRNPRGDTQGRGFPNGAQRARLRGSPSIEKRYPLLLRRLEAAVLVDPRYRGHGQLSVLSTMQRLANSSDNHTRLRQDRVDQVVSWNELKKPLGWGSDGEQTEMAACDW